MIAFYPTLEPEVVVNVVNGCTEHLNRPTLTGQCEVNNIFHILASCSWSMWNFSFLCREKWPAKGLFTSYLQILMGHIN